MTNIIRRDPFFELAGMPERMNEFFNRTFGFDPAGLELPTFPTNFVPPVNIFEDAHNITLQAEIPGVSLEDLKITFENNTLTITGERKFKEEEKKENFYRLERRFGKFTRSFTLPVGVDPEKVNAVFENGVLDIRLAKREEFKPKQITIGVTKPSAVGAKAGKAA